jgi:hypothetical protein
MVYEDILSDEAQNRIQKADVNKKTQTDHLDDIKSLYDADMVDHITQHPYHTGQTVIELLTKVYQLREQVEESQCMQRQYVVMTDVMVQHMKRESHKDCCMHLFGNALVDHGLLKINCDAQEYITHEEN